MWGKIREEGVIDLLRKGNVLCCYAKAMLCVAMQGKVVLCKGSAKQGEVLHGEGKVMSCNAPSRLYFDRGSNQVPSSPSSLFVEGSALYLLREPEGATKERALPREAQRGLRQDDPLYVLTCKRPPLRDNAICPFEGISLYFAPGDPLNERVKGEIRGALFPPPYKPNMKAFLYA